MNNDLKSELQALLDRYAELNDASVTFAGGEILITANEAASALRTKCKPDLELPAVIRGSGGKIEARFSGVHGYGVFAKEPIAEGELIEECKLLKLGWRAEFMKDPVLQEYVWGNNCDCEECKTYGRTQYLGLGFGSLYNHAEQTNTHQKVDFVKETITIYAQRDIAADEEIFLKYGKKYWIIRDFWKSVTDKQLKAAQEKK
jgi:hypothetical protein